MKVLHVVYQFWPTRRGAVFRTLNVIKATRQFGCKVVVVSSPFQRPAGSAGLEMLDSVRVYRTSHLGMGYGFEDAGGLLGRLRKLSALPAFAKAVVSIARAENVDLLHANGTFFTGLAAIYAGQVLGLPTIYEVRSAWEVEALSGPARWPQRAVAWLAEYAASHLATWTVYNSARLEDHYRPRKDGQSAVIYNALEWPAVPPSPPCGDPDMLRLGYVGSLVRYEGLDLLLAAVARLRAVGIPLHLDVVGAGPAETALKSIARHLGVNSDVTFHGFLEGDDLECVWQRIDVLVLPRRREPVTELVAGLKPLEAFKRAKCVVCSDVGGHREIIDHGETGLYFEAGNLDALCDTLLRLYRDPELRARIGQRAFELGRRRFGLERMARDYLVVYKAALGVC